MYEEQNFAFSFSYFPFHFSYFVIIHYLCTRFQEMRKIFTIILLIFYV